MSTAARRDLAIVYVLALVGLTAFRVPVWQTDLSLWTDAAIGSEKPRAWVNLGTARLELGDVVGARQAYDRARVLVESPVRAQDRSLILSTLQASEIYFALARGDQAEAKRVATEVVKTWPTWDVGRTLCAGLQCDQP